MAMRSRLYTDCSTWNTDSRAFSSKCYIVALLDICIDDRYLQEQFHQPPNYNYYRTVTINDCIDRLNNKQTKDAQLVLIISERFLDIVQNQLFAVRSVLPQIYLFDRAPSHQLLSSDRRIRESFDSAQLLVQKIKSDTIEPQTFRKNYDSIEYVAEGSAKFYSYRFFFNILKHLWYGDIAREELAASMRNYVENKSYYSGIAAEFERTYEPSKAIWLYTRDAPFYGSLNNALCSNDFNQIFSHRLMIRNLAEALEKLNHDHKHRKPLVVYRGQALRVEQINMMKASIGKLITATSFLSTSLNRELALSFLPSDFRNTSSCFEAVFFEIHIESMRNDVIGACTYDYSCFPDERELLFSFQSLFRIQKVQLIDHIWHIMLVAVDETDKAFRNAIDPWKISIGENSFFSGRNEPLFSRYLNAGSDGSRKLPRRVWKGVRHIVALFFKGSSAAVPVDPPQNTANGPFIAFQLMIDMMLRLDRTEFARQEMLEMLQRLYADRPNDLEFILRFEEQYHYVDAIKWYTANSFLYRLLHQSLRMEKIDTIFKLRFYIHDLHNQLAQQQQQYLNSLPHDQTILTLYRGQRMSRRELNNHRRNINQLMSMNSFLSTTEDCAAAVFFAGDGSLDEPKSEVSVLYQITVDTNIPHCVPFARIQSQSIFQDESEVLFSMAAVFRIDQVEPYGTLWVVDLTLINKEDEHWNALTAHLNN